MKLSKKLILFISGFALSVLVFLCSLYFTYKSEEDLNDQFESWENDYLIISTTKSMINTLYSVENDVRGYIISGDQKYINDYQLLRTSIQLMIDELKHSSKNNPNEYAKAVKLCEVTNSKLDHLFDKITHFSHPTYNQEELLKKIDLGNQMMDEIRIMEENIINYRLNQLQVKKKNAVKAVQNTQFKILILAIASIAMFTFMFLFLKYYLVKRASEEKELKELNENKNKFFSIISHDLRNPVKNIALMSELLISGKTSKTYDPQKIVSMIHGSANNLSSLLDNLLKWSRLQMNDIAINPEILELHKVTLDVIRHQQSNAANKKIEINNYVNSNALVIGDQNMVTSVLRNLLSNAIKFTDKGGKIDFFSQERNGMIQISISDNGVGMPQEVADKLFSIDFKISTKGTNKEEGTGLGLKICKEFVEKNKGKIYVESAVNKGTTFFVSFPMPV